jgi:hypothetical protein
MKDENAMGFEFLMALIVKRISIWDDTPCNLI